MMPRMTDTHASDPATPIAANYELVYDLARANLDAQLSNADAIDAKIGGVVGVSTAFIGILAAVLALKPTAVHDDGARWLALLTIGLFLGILACGFSLIRLPSWSVGPGLYEPGDIRRFLGNVADGRKIAARNLVASYSQNKDLYGAKLCRLRVGVAGLILQTIALLALSLHLSGLVP
jgi:hypothetical protein